MEKIDNIILVKVGTSTLTTAENKLDSSSFNRIGAQLISLKDEGYNPIVISSAAITAGMIETGLTQRPSKETEMPELQRLASIGWRLTLNQWAAAVPNKTIGELLLTRNELDMPHERDEVLRVTHSLLSHGDIPIVNENDAITHEEIAFGDNDKVSAIFAAQIARSALFGNNIKLVLLSDVDGVYADQNDKSSVIPVITDTNKYQSIAGDSGSTNGSGGMRTKFEARDIANESGVETWITNGRTENAISRTLNGEIGTHFPLA